MGLRETHLGQMCLKKNQRLGGVKRGVGRGMRLSIWAKCARSHPGQG